MIDTQGLFRSGLIARLARGSRHGFDAESVRESWAALFYDVKHRVDWSLHAVTRNRLLPGQNINSQLVELNAQGINFSVRVDNDFGQRHV